MKTWCGDDNNYVYIIIFITYYISSYSPCRAEFIYIKIIHYICVFMKINKKKKRKFICVSALSYLPPIDTAKTNLILIW